MALIRQKYMEAKCLFLYETMMRDYLSPRSLMNAWKFLSSSNDLAHDIKAAVSPTVSSL
jgi:hypothetical protein